MKKLTTRRSDLRFAIYLSGFALMGFAALVIPVEPLWLRIVVGLMVASTLYHAVNYVVYVRRKWRRYADRFEVPTLKHPQRSFPLTPDLETVLIDYYGFGFGSVINLQKPGSPRPDAMIGFSVFVSRRDIADWSKVDD